MALISCPECSSQVSDSAVKCPSCAVQLRKPKRGFFGKLIKFSFIAFNILMLVWIIGGYNSASEGIEQLSGAEQAGAAIGTGLGIAMLSSLWIVGDIILGLFVLFTRPKS
ncbi:zinc ribbon domain-containing protein [Lonsdalea quercina]|uniref:zinc ribbon domain-containing protein n=1 Tax=Lonsdalea quercina TaxID=71657 RepID=UPI00047AE330|nr:zinc ribbon domain-containing protein [Lonsdalea quercina]